jgi:hypothetical protein
MGVEVIGDLAHLAVDGEVVSPETGRGDPFEMGQHVGQVSIPWPCAVVAPHNDGNTTGLTIGDPADLVLVVPLGHPSRFAELTYRQSPTCSPPRIGRAPSAHVGSVAALLALLARSDAPSDGPRSHPSPRLTTVRGCAQ